MPRFVVFLGALIPLLGTGCEDGPNQPYSPAPPGASATWNGPPSAGIPDGGVYVPPATEGFDASFGGQNANDLCTATQKKAVWDKLFGEPIQVPGLAGGIDIAGGPKGDGSSGYDPTVPFKYDPSTETWTGATVEQAEQILCQGEADSIYYGITSTLGWGEGCPNCDLSVLYNSNSRQITDLLFQYGYQGTADAVSVDQKTKYSISLNNVPISKTTASGTVQLLLDWSSEASLNAQVNALYDAFRNTYAPTFPADTDCVGAGHCIIGNNYAEGGYIWFTPLNLTFFVNTTVGSPQANSIPALVDLGLLKLLPFSSAGTTLKLDLAGEGPVSFVPKVGGTTHNCKYVLGMSFGDFDANCVEPFPSGDKNNTVNRNKLFGAMSHGDEAYNFDVVGVDPQFAASLAANTVVSDAQRPSATDVAYELTVDQEDIGTIANDYTNNDVTQAQDWHGNGMVTLEWANLVQQYMKAGYGVTSDLGDPACIANPAAPGVAGKVCSGIEGIVTTAPPALAAPSMAVNALGANGVNVDPTLAVGMKPGTWYSVFCATSGKPDGTGYDQCFGGVNGGYFFDTMQTAVAKSFGTNPVPETLGSRRFYFQQWILALVKFLHTADNPNAMTANLRTSEITGNPIAARVTAPSLVTADPNTKRMAGSTN